MKRYAIEARADYAQDFSIPGAEILEYRHNQDGTVLFLAEADRKIHFAAINVPGILLVEPL